jgi:hypothetical protein
MKQIIGNSTIQQNNVIVKPISTNNLINATNVVLVVINVLMTLTVKYVIQPIIGNSTIQINAIVKSVTSMIIIIALHVIPVVICVIITKPASIVVRVTIGF